MVALGITYLIPKTTTKRFRGRKSYFADESKPHMSVGDTVFEVEVRAKTSRR
jgi:hypothetical protein